ncbi:MAG: DUF4097 family beta strand repeat protein [Candidatus Eisenbacteria bacterium]|nr:DUF4097 family beta strand repeat protein [Candidatus Eisenbacteria bacterium]
MRPIVFTAAALAALTLATPAHAAKVRDWNKSWNVSSTPVIRIVTDEARVRVHRGEGGRVVARVHYSVSSWGLTSGPREPKVELEQSGDTVRIVAREQHDWVVFGAIETKFEVDVTVPGDCDLSARSGDGSINCEALQGAIALESGDGAIRATGLRGDVVLMSGDGGIDADSLDGSLLARTGDGRLRVAGRFDRLDLRTGDGRLEATVRAGSQAAEAWNVESGDGSITLRIPRDLSVLLDAGTRDGALRVDLPVTTRGAIRHDTLAGSLNGGSVPLRVRSADGDITLALSP